MAEKKRPNVVLIMTDNQPAAQARVSFGGNTKIGCPFRKGGEARFGDFGIGKKQIRQVLHL